MVGFGLDRWSERCGVTSVGQRKVEPVDLEEMKGEVGSFDAELARVDAG